MTDLPGTRARWTAAALLAPAAAAVFTGTAVWAQTHTPVLEVSGSSPAPATVAAAASPTLDPAVAALRVQVARSAAQVTALRLTVARLTRVSASTSGRSTTARGGTSRPSSAGSGTTGSGRRSTKVTKVVVVTAPAPAPPPPATTTGASGAKP